MIAGNPAYVRQVISYDPATGEIRRTSDNKPVNLRAKGTTSATVELGGRRYAAKRLVWAYMTGDWPPGKQHAVKVRNGDQFDLRWENLVVVPDDHGFCGACREVLPQDKFTLVRGKGGTLRTYGFCKECCAARRKDTDHAHLQSCRKRGMTPEDYAEMLASQNGGCAICGDPPGDRRLAIDHCHTTGEVRGLLCGPCNTSLGQFKDDPRLLLEAAKYVLRSRGKSV